MPGRELASRMILRMLRSAPWRRRLRRHRRQRLDDVQSFSGHPSAVVIRSLLFTFYLPPPSKSKTLRETLNFGSGEPWKTTNRCASFGCFTPWYSRPTSASVDPVRDRTVKNYDIFHGHMTTAQDPPWFSVCLSPRMVPRQGHVVAEPTKT